MGSKPELASHEDHDARRAATRRQTRSCGLPQPGQKCPQCHAGKLDFDGLLNLVCGKCGQIAFSGSFT